jgi:anti-sigma factor RsiW
MSEHLHDLLSALLDGELPSSAEAAARQHAASCPQCSAELEDVRVARAWVRALPAVEPPFGFFERLIREPAGARPRRWWASRRVALAAVAGSAAAAVTLVGLAPPRDAPVSPSVGRFVEAHATGASLSGDPLSRLAPIGVPVTFRR